MWLKSVCLRRSWRKMITTGQSLTVLDDRSLRLWWEMSISLSLLQRLGHLLMFRAVRILKGFAYFIIWFRSANIHCQSAIYSLHPCPIPLLVFVWYHWLWGEGFSFLFLLFLLIDSLWRWFCFHWWTLLDWYLLICFCIGT